MPHKSVKIDTVQARPGNHGSASERVYIGTITYQGGCSTKFHMLEETFRMPKGSSVTTRSHVTVTDLDNGPLPGAMVNDIIERVQASEEYIRV